MGEGPYRTAAPPTRRRFWLPLPLRKTLCAVWGHDQHVRHGYPLATCDRCEAIWRRYIDEWTGRAVWLRIDGWGFERTAAPRD